MTVQYHRAAPVELQGQFRAASDGSTTFEGYTAVFGQWSKDISDDLGKGYREVIQPGAFRRTLGLGRRISFVVDHDERQMISSFPAGQLRLAEDSTGLHVESPWPRTDYADNARALFDAGERLGMSMLFATPAKGDSWNATHSERSVHEAILKHASVLATMEAAYDTPTGTFRALAEMTEAPVEDVDALMDALRDGRRLNDGEFNLLNRLAEAVRPEVETAPAVAETSEDLTRWAERLAAIEAELPTS
jgi:HK97 family phage prohead protease